jgi:hypothetical protein
MAAAPSAASAGPAAAMATPLGDHLRERPSWESPLRTVEARGPLGALARRLGVGVGVARAVQKSRDAKRALMAVICCRTCCSSD